MKNIEFEIRNDNTEEVLSATDEAIERALEAIGLQAEGYAKLLCPVDTGRLRNSITHEVAANEKAVYIGTNVEYGPYVEMGTARTRPQPFIRPAVENHLDEYKQISEANLRG